MNSKSADPVAERRTASVYRPAYLWVGMVAGLFWLGGFGSLTALAAVGFYLVEVNRPGRARSGLVWLVAAVGIAGLAWSPSLHSLLHRRARYEWAIGRPGRHWIAVWYALAGVAWMSLISDIHPVAWPINIAIGIAAWLLLARSARGDEKGTP